MTDKRVYVKFGNEWVRAVLWHAPSKPEDLDPGSIDHNMHCVWVEGSGEYWVNGSRIRYALEDNEKGLRNTALFFQSKGSDQPDKMTVNAVKNMNFNR